MHQWKKQQPQQNRCGGLWPPHPPPPLVGSYSAVAAVGAAAFFIDALTDVFTGVFTDVFTDVFLDVVTGAFTGAFIEMQMMEGFCTCFLCPFGSFATNNPRMKQ